MLDYDELVAVRARRYVIFAREARPIRASGSFLDFNRFADEVRSPLVAPALRINALAVGRVRPVRVSLYDVVRYPPIQRRFRGPRAVGSPFCVSGCGRREDGEQQRLPTGWAGRRFGAAGRTCATIPLRRLPEVCFREASGRRVLRIISGICVNDCEPVERSWFQNSNRSKLPASMNQVTRLPQRADHRFDEGKLRQIPRRSAWYMHGGGFSMTVLTFRVVHQEICHPYRRCGAMTLKPGSCFVSACPGGASSLPTRRSETRRLGITGGERTKKSGGASMRSSDASSGDVNVTLDGRGRHESAKPDDGGGWQCSSDVIHPGSRFTIGDWAARDTFRSPRFGGYRA